MEVLGAIAALETLKVRCRVVLTTDSRYVIDPINKGWAKKWRANDWDDGDRLNADLWAKLLELVEKHDVSFSVVCAVIQVIQKTNVATLSRKKPLRVKTCVKIQGTRLRLKTMLRNPKNGNPRDECHKKKSRSKQPLMAGLRNKHSLNGVCRGPHRKVGANA